MASSEEKSIAVLISGGGTTLRNLITKVDDGMLDAQIGVVISSTQNAGGLQFSAEAEIPNRCVERSEFASDAEFSDALFSICREFNVDYVVMGGFLKRVVIPSDFSNRVVNIHPSLIPAFCGQGFTGIMSMRQCYNMVHECPDVRSTLSMMNTIMDRSSCSVRS